jgi:hypothetical protein
MVCGSSHQAGRLEPAIQASVYLHADALAFHFVGLK